ncbi:hypothetical protein V6N13_081468 [Hibiscus sabdariffa]
MRSKQQPFNSNEKLPTSRKESKHTLSSVLFLREPPYKMGLKRSYGRRWKNNEEYKTRKSVKRGKERHIAKATTDWESDGDALSLWTGPDVVAKLHTDKGISLKQRTGNSIIFC